MSTIVSRLIAPISIELRRHYLRMTIEKNPLILIHVTTDIIRLIS